MKEKNIGFIGAGNMASALMQGMIQSGQFNAGQIRINDRVHSYHPSHPATVYHIAQLDKQALLQWADVLILAVKPQDLFDVLLEIDPLIQDRLLLISIAAGVDITHIAQSLTSSVPIIRAMPNMSAQVLASATALSAHSLVTEEELTFAQSVFRCVGTVRLVPEEQMDAVTGLSGSGPAYVYTFLKAMIEGGQQAGLSYQDAASLSLQTLRGAIEMVTITGEDPETLTRRICSPNGTTLAGLHVLKSRGFEEHVVEAIKAATHRSQELRQENHQASPGKD